MVRLLCEFGETYASRDRAIATGSIQGLFHHQLKGISAVFETFLDLGKATMASSYEEPWFCYHVPPSCHFISVMTHRFSIYATNFIEDGCGPSQSQAGPAVHLGKRRWLNWLGRARSVSLSPTWQTGSSPSSSSSSSSGTGRLGFLHSYLVCLMGGRRQVGAVCPGLGHLTFWDM